MPSKARKAFDENAEDIKRLLKLHTAKGGDKKGRRYGLAVLNKSAIVLTTAFWEAYCEDIAAEALQHLIEHTESANTLPKDLKKRIANELKKEQNHIAIWSLCDDGWRDVIRARLTDLREGRNRRLNTPKSHQIDELFHEAIGISKISSAWFWPKKMTVRRARTKLDKYVTLRGEIAHRGNAAGSVKKIAVTDYFDFIKRLVSKTGGAVNGHVKKTTGESLW